MKQKKMNNKTPKKILKKLIIALTSLTQELLTLPPNTTLPQFYLSPGDIIPLNLCGIVNFVGDLNPTLETESTGVDIINSFQEISKSNISFIFDDYWVSSFKKDISVSLLMKNVKGRNLFGYINFEKSSFYKAIVDNSFNPTMDKDDKIYTDCKGSLNLDEGILILCGKKKVKSDGGDDVIWLNLFFWYTDYPFSSKSFDLVEIENFLFGKKLKIFEVNKKNKRGFLVLYQTETQDYEVNKGYFLHYEQTGEKFDLKNFKAISLENKLPFTEISSVTQPWRSLKRHYANESDFIIFGNSKNLRNFYLVNITETGEVETLTLKTNFYEPTKSIWALDQDFIYMFTTAKNSENNYTITAIMRKSDWLETNKVEEILLSFVLEVKSNTKKVHMYEGSLASTYLIELENGGHVSGIFDKKQKNSQMKIEYCRVPLGPFPAKSNIIRICSDMKYRMKLGCPEILLKADNLKTDKDFNFKGEFIVKDHQNLFIITHIVPFSGQIIQTPAKFLDIMYTPSTFETYNGEFRDTLPVSMNQIRGSDLAFEHDQAEKISLRDQVFEEISLDELENLNIDTSSDIRISNNVLITTRYIDGKIVANLYKSEIWDLKMKLTLMNDDPVELEGADNNEKIISSFFVKKYFVFITEENLILRKTKYRIYFLYKPNYYAEIHSIIRKTSEPNTFFIVKKKDKQSTSLMMMYVSTGNEILLYELDAEDKTHFKEMGELNRTSLNEHAFCPKNIKPDYNNQGYMLVYSDCGQGFKVFFFLDIFKNVIDRTKTIQVRETKSKPAKFQFCQLTDEILLKFSRGKDRLKGLKSSNFIDSYVRYPTPKDLKINNKARMYCYEKQRISIIQTKSRNGVYSEKTQRMIIYKSGNVFNADRRFYHDYIFDPSVTEINLTVLGNSFILIYKITGSKFYSAMRLYFDGPTFKLQSKLLYEEEIPLKLTVSNGNVKEAGVRKILKIPLKFHNPLLFPKIKKIKKFEFDSKEYFLDDYIKISGPIYDHRVQRVSEGDSRVSKIEVMTYNISKSYKLDVRVRFYLDKIYVDSNKETIMGSVYYEQFIKTFVYIFNSDLEVIGSFSLPLNCFKLQNSRVKNSKKHIWVVGVCEVESSFKMMKVFVVEVEENGKVEEIGSYDFGDIKRFKYFKTRSFSKDSHLIHVEFNQEKSWKFGDVSFYNEKNFFYNDISLSSKVSNCKNFYSNLFSQNIISKIKIIF